MGVTSGPGLLRVAVFVAIGACGGSTVLSVGPEAGTPDANGNGTADATIDVQDDEPPVDTGDAAIDDGPKADTARPPLCPPVAPAVGGSCSIESLRCEYGDSNDPLCNTTYSCDSGQWSLYHDGKTCGFNGTNDPGCPAKYADIMNGGSCTGPGICDYPEGRCQCVTHCGGRPPPDASSFWSCVVASAGCPSPRGGNRLGTSCQTPGLTCDYTACCNGLVQVCGDAGVWAGSYTLPCPP
jgi:hypothetical protein